MKRVLLILVAVVIALYIAVINIPIDPVERRPGTRLSGDLARLDPAQDAHWSFVQGRTQAWVETRTWYLIPHSITVSAWAEDDGALYVGCIRCDTKTWPKHVARDDRVRLKIGDAIYPCRAVRIADAAERRAIMGDRGVVPGYALFRMEPR